MTRTKVRSPNYPAIPLEEAIIKIKTIYDQEYKNPTDKEVIAKHLGYNGINGTSLAIISALYKYELLEPTDSKQLRVSEEAQSILWLEKGDPERVKLLRKAAFAPSLFAELRETFPEKLPSDQTLRHHLIKKEFNPKVVDAVIRAYRDTLEFVNAEEALVASASEGNEQPLEEPMQTQSSKDAHSSYSGNTNSVTTAREDYLSRSDNTNSVQTSLDQLITGEILQYRISEDCTVRVQFNGSVTQEGIKKLIALLELNADTYPTKQSQKSLTKSRAEKANYWQAELFEEEELIDEEQ